MDYTPEHVADALSIIERLRPIVSPRSEYQELISILREPSRWKDAHDVFDKIRESITLPDERENKRDLDSYFAYVAENPAKTAYNCSGEPAPFDDDSYEWLLKCEKEFDQKHADGLAKREASHDLQDSGWSWIRRIFNPGKRAKY